MEFLPNSGRLVVGRRAKDPVGKFERQYHE